MTEIRSYRNVFALERRIYRIDRLHLNPSGIPIRGVLYWLTGLAALAIASRVPFIGIALVWMPWYLRELLLPGLVAWLMCAIRVDGRPFHIAGFAIIRYTIGPRYCCALHSRLALARGWSPTELLVLPDDPGASRRRLRYNGPGRVSQPTTGRAIVLGRGSRLEIG